MKKPVCNFNCFECPRPDCKREDSRKGEGALPKEQRQIHSKRACLSREQ